MRTKYRDVRRATVAASSVFVIIFLLCSFVYLYANSSCRLLGIAYRRDINELLHQCTNALPSILHGSIGTPPDQSRGDRPKPMIGICVPARSLPDWTSLTQTVLQTIMIPSMARTVTAAELDAYQIHMYLGINHDDVFWIENTSKLNKSDWLVVHAGFYNMTEHRVPYNEVTKAAYDDGAEYILRLTDDTEFVTTAWITAGVKTLSGYDPPNVGVVGPTCNEGNTAIMTHDMVHRAHCDIFGDYYPPVFDNWFVDDWITHVYEPGRSTKLRGWVIKHHTSKQGTRYSPNEPQRQLVKDETTKCQATLVKYLQSQNATRSVGLK